MVRLLADDPLAKVDVPHFAAQSGAELLAVLDRVAHTGAPVAMLGMGDAGRLTRLVGPACGSFLTFARRGAASAPGQLDLALVAATVDALRAPERS